MSPFTLDAYDESMAWVIAEERLTPLRGSQSKNNIISLPRSTQRSAKKIMLRFCLSSAYFASFAVKSFESVIQEEGV